MDATFRYGWFRLAMWTGKNRPQWTLWKIRRHQPVGTLEVLLRCLLLTCATSVAAAAAAAAATAAATITAAAPLELLLDEPHYVDMMALLLESRVIPAVPYNLWRIVIARIIDDAYTVDMVAGREALHALGGLLCGALDMFPVGLPS